MTTTAQLVRKKWGQNVRRYRTAAGLTQVALATKLRIDQSTLSRIESGDLRVIDPELILRFAVVLEVDPEHIFEWPVGIRAVAASVAS